MFYNLIILPVSIQKDYDLVYVFNYINLSGDLITATKARRIS